MNTYTVFAVYEENLQPYSTTVEAGNPEAAIRLAQVQCLEDNDADYGAHILVGCQVVAGEVEVLSVDDMPLEIGQPVRWQGSLVEPWTIKAFITDAPEFRAYIERNSFIANVRTHDLTPLEG